MNMATPNLSATTILESDYRHIREFYGRDLGGYDFFIWKHFSDIDNQHAPIKRVLRYPTKTMVQGIIISTLYSFKYNNQHRIINLIGDLGIEDSVKSPHLVKHLILSASQQNADIVLCFSDNRKIRIYKKILDKGTDSTNFIIPFIDVIVQPPSRQVRYDEISMDELHPQNFVNNLGRNKTPHYFTYLVKNPRYQSFHALRYQKFYCVIAVTENYAEIVELSETSDEIFDWAIQVSLHFHRYCKILLPRNRFNQITKNILKIIEEKDFNLLLSNRSNKDFDIDPENIWISRLDRR